MDHRKTGVPYAVRGCHNSCKIRMFALSTSLMADPRKIIRPPRNDAPVKTPRRRLVRIYPQTGMLQLLVKLPALTKDIV